MKPELVYDTDLQTFRQICTSGNFRWNCCWRRRWFSLGLFVCMGNHQD